MDSTVATEATENLGAKRKLRIFSPRLTPLLMPKGRGAGSPRGSPPTRDTAPDDSARRQASWVASSAPLPWPHSLALPGCVFPFSTCSMSQECRLPRGRTLTGWLLMAMTRVMTRGTVAGFVAAGASTGFFCVGGSSMATPLFSILGVTPRHCPPPSRRRLPAASVAYIRNRTARPKAAGWSLVGGVPAAVGGAFLSRVVGGPKLVVASGVVLVQRVSSVHRSVG